MKLDIILRGTKTQFGTICGAIPLNAAPTANVPKPSTQFSPFLKTNDHREEGSYASDMLDYIDG